MAREAAGVRASVPGRTVRGTGNASTSTIGGGDFQRTGVAAIWRAANRRRSPITPPPIISWANNRAPFSQLPEPGGYNCAHRRGDGEEDRRGVVQSGFHFQQGSDGVRGQCKVARAAQQCRATAAASVGATAAPTSMAIMKRHAGEQHDSHADDARQSIATPRVTSQGQRRPDRRGAASRGVSEDRPGTGSPRAATLPTR